MSRSNVLGVGVAAFAVFMGGFVVAKTEVFPFGIANFTYMIGQVIAAPFYVDDIREETQWTLDRWNGKVFVTKNIVEKQDQTLDHILYSSSNSTDVRLMDRAGDVLHTWQIPFSKVWGDNQSHLNLAKKVTDDFFYIRDFHLYDNGDLLVMMNIAGATPWGAGIIKVDKDSNVLWSWKGSTNNDLEVSPAGNILITNQEVRIQDLTGIVEKAEGAYISGELVVLKPDGEVMDKLSVVDAILESEYKDMVEFYEIKGGDFLHFNSIEYIEADHPTIPWIKKGNIVMSIRNMNTIIVYEPMAQKIVHAFRGGFVMQHDIDYDPKSQTFMVFDNRGALGAGRHTRVLEFSPENLAEIWSYEGTEEEPLQTDFWGAQQKLSNNNVMTIEADQGRIIEVTRDGEIVWEYFYPEKKYKAGKKYTTTITSFEAIGKERLTWMP